MQVVTDKDALLMKTKMMLMTWRLYVSWSLCAAHCLDLIVDDIKEGNSIKEGGRKGKENHQLHLMVQPADINGETVCQLQPPTTFIVQCYKT